MIYIICGEYNQGKTAKIKSIYLEQKEGDGFITQKIFRNSIFCGYEIVRLSTGETVTQSLKTELFPLDKKPLFAYGPFSFCHYGFSFADSIIDDIINTETDPVFIDEIGPIELEGNGHHNCFTKILKTDRTIYFTVRKYSLEKVISFFSLKDYVLIKI